MDYIRLKDVYKTMKGTQVLKGVNLTVEQGNIVGIRGINGSGKTMVLRAIAGLISRVTRPWWKVRSNLSTAVSIPTWKGACSMTSPL